jgi:hypothetical protein
VGHGLIPRAEVVGHQVFLPVESQAYWMNIKREVVKEAVEQPSSLPRSWRRRVDRMRPPRQPMEAGGGMLAESPPPEGDAQARELTSPHGRSPPLLRRNTTVADAESLKVATIAGTAADVWNESVSVWNQSSERAGKPRGQRTTDPKGK